MPERTIAEIEEENDRVEERAGVLEDIIYNLEETLEDMPSLKNVPLSEEAKAAMEVFVTGLRESLKEARTEMKMRDRQMGKLAKELKEAKKKGCKHENLRCVDCGVRVVKK